MRSSRNTSETSKKDSQSSARPQIVFRSALIVDADKYAGNLALDLVFALVVDGKTIVDHIPARFDEADTDNDCLVYSLGNAILSPELRCEMWRICAMLTSSMVDRKPRWKSDRGFSIDGSTLREFIA